MLCGLVQKNILKKEKDELLWEYLKDKSVKISQMILVGILGTFRGIYIKIFLIKLIVFGKKNDFLVISSYDPEWLRQTNGRARIWSEAPSR